MAKESQSVMGVRMLRLVKHYGIYGLQILLFIHEHHFFNQAKYHHFVLKYIKQNGIQNGWSFI